MQEVTLQQMLEARECRAARQQQLLGEYGLPVICFSMNIPGPVKNSPLIRRAFRVGCQHLEHRLPSICHKEVQDAVTGCEAIYVCQGDALQLKAVCTALEDENALGRLFDMDVLDTEGHKLERAAVKGEERNCIVCGAPGRGCASRRLHSVAELQTAVQTIMVDFFTQADRDRIASLAVQSLLDEVCTTPKPGLVDRRNSGSHEDMDIFCFTASAAALHPYFRTCVAIGQHTSDDSPEETFGQLRQAGLQAEQDMYAATGGVNTHKGAIYTMGILCGSLGRLWRAERPIGRLEDILTECAKLAAPSARRDLAQLSLPATAGEQLYLTEGIWGVRGEASHGLPSAAKIGLPVFRACLEEGYSRNDAGAITLLHLIAQVEDTNLYHRGGKEGAAWAAQSASQLLPRPSMDAIAALDDQFICRNLSPGGCADLLAVTYFLHALTSKEL